MGRDYRLYLPVEHFPNGLGLKMGVFFMEEMIKRVVSRINTFKG